MIQASSPAFSAFANTIYDTATLNRLIDDITLIERSLFKGKSGPISVKARDFTTGRIIPVFEEIEKAGLEPTNESKQLAFLKDLASFLQALPVVKVTVAFDPTSNLVVKLSNQLSQVLGKKVILDLVIDENVIAGAIFEYKGMRSEQTLQEKLELQIRGLLDQPIDKHNKLIFLTP